LFKKIKQSGLVKPVVITELKKRELPLTHRLKIKGVTPSKQSALTET